MLRKLMVVGVLLGLMAGVAVAGEVQVTGANLTGNRQTPTGKGLTDVGTSFDEVVLKWDIDLNTTTDQWTYDSWFTGDEAPNVGTWYLELSESITMASLAPTGGTSMTVVDDAAPIATKTFDNAIKFTGDDGSGHYTFWSFINPVWGDAFIYGDASNYVYNSGFGGGPLQTETEFLNWVATVDTGALGGDVVIPEPSISVLALTALLGGAFARRRKKKK